MTSGPYQSNVLRFFVRQYWQGLARHKKAVRQTRYTVVSGAQVGCSVSIALAKMAIAAARTTGAKVKRLTSKPQGQKTLLSGLRDEVVSLLDVSNFAHLPSDGDELALTRSDDVVLLAERGGMVAEWVMARSLVAVAGCLSTEQVELLSNPDERSESTDSVLTRCVKWGKQSLCQWFGNGSIRSSNPSLVSPSQVGVCKKIRLITGVASDLKTRSLVLIRDYRWVWDGLSAEQQNHLHRKIAVLLADSTLAKDWPWSLTGNVLGERALSGAMNLAVSEKSHDLAVPTLSFWVEVLRVVAWLHQRVSRVWCLPGSRFRLAGGVSWLADSGSIVDWFEGVGFGSGVILPGSGLAIARRSSSETTDGQNASSRWDASDCIEASVLTEIYVEHPLEKLLNWIDRCLLWLENCWRRLTTWLRWQ